MNYQGFNEADLFLSSLGVPPFNEAPAHVIGDAADNALYDIFSASSTNDDTTPPQFSNYNYLQSPFSSSNNTSPTLDQIPLQQVKNEAPEFPVLDQLPSPHSEPKAAPKKRASRVAKPPKKEKTSHNMIEKRYRTNINDKINALRDSVPALRVLVENGCTGVVDDDIELEGSEGLDGLQPARKLNKASILSKATEYIKHLESKNSSLKMENDQLRMMLRHNGINVPEGRSTSVVSASSTQASPGAYPLGTKLMLGGMACALGSTLQDDVHNARSLFAMPGFQLSSSGLHVTNTSGLVSLMRVFTLLAGVLYVLLPSLFITKEKKTKLDENSLSFEDLSSSLFKVYFNTAVKYSSKSLQFFESQVVKCYLLKKYHNPLANYLASTTWAKTRSEFAKCKRNDFQWNTLEKLLSQEEISDEIVSRLGDVHANISEVIHKIVVLSKEHELNQLLIKFAAQEEEDERITSSDSEVSCILDVLYQPSHDNIDTLVSLVKKQEPKNPDETILLTTAMLRVTKDEKWFKNLQTSSFNLLGFVAMLQCVPVLEGDQKEQLCGLLRIWLSSKASECLGEDCRHRLIGHLRDVLESELVL